MYSQPLRLLAFVLVLLAVSSWAQHAYVQLDFGLYKDHKWRCVDDLGKKVKLYSYDARVFATCDLDLSFGRGTKDPKPANATVTIKCGASGKDDSWMVVTWGNDGRRHFDRSEGGKYWNVGWIYGRYTSVMYDVSEDKAGIMVNVNSQGDNERNIYADQRTINGGKSVEEVLASTRSTAVRRRGTKPPKGVPLSS